jgi:4-hydroxy-tetrahydrodipicolinate synthase
MSHFGGLYVPIITPFSASGDVAFKPLERLAERLLEEGAAGLVPLGTAGEGALLSSEERLTVVAACASVCESRGRQLIVGAGTNDTRQTVEAVRALEGTPALSGILVLVPYYLRPTQRGIIAHFQAVAAASPAPVVIYNIPFRTGVSVEPDTLLALAAVENIAGVKHSIGSLDEAGEQLLAQAPPDFAVLCGDDAHLAASVLMGAAGGITASAHLCTKRWVALVESARAGEVRTAREHQAVLLPLVRAGFSEPSPSVFKAALHRNCEIPTDQVRLPFVPASQQRVEEALTAAAAAMDDRSPAAR